MNGKLAVFVCIIAVLGVGASAGVWLADDFADGTQSDSWAVFGNTNAPAVLQEENGVLLISARGVDDDGTLGYLTTSTYPWQDTGTSYVFSLWISNISVTVTSTAEFSQQAFISLVSESNKHYMATNAITLYANYFPDVDELELSLATKTNRYEGGGAYGSMGTWRYAARITNFSGIIATGPVRVQMMLRSGVLAAGAFDANDQPIPVNRVMGKPSVIHNVQTLYDPLIMIGAGNSVQGRGSVQLDAFEASSDDDQVPGRLFFDDFNDEATYNFWSWMPAGTTWGLEETNGALGVYPVFWLTESDSKFLSLSDPMPMNLETHGYAFSANLSTVSVVSGVGERSMLVLADSQLDPWPATNVIYVAGDYIHADDTWRASLYIENNGGSGYGSLRFTGLLSNFSAYAASGGLDISLALTNGLYALHIQDTSGVDVVFDEVDGSMTGAHGLDASVFTSAYWSIGAQNIGATDGKVMWGETEGYQFDATPGLWFDLYDDFESTNTLSWWRIIDGTWTAGGELAQPEGRLFIHPGWLDDMMGGYVTHAPLDLSAPSFSYMFKATLSTVQVDEVYTWDSDMRGSFYLTPSSNQDYWVSPVALSVFCEYEESNDWLTVFLYTKTNIVSAKGQERFRGVITGYNERAQSAGGCTVQLEIQGDDYILQVLDDTGADYPVEQITGAWSGPHDLGDTLHTGHWFLAAQNMGTGRGAMWWDHAAIYRTAAGGTPGDEDGDGIPDWWELAYFGSTTGATAGEDSDGDAYNNYLEYIALTVPTNAESFFRAGTAQPVTSEGHHAMAISWWGMTGRVYDVLFTVGGISNDVSFTPLEGAEDLTAVDSNQFLTVTDTNVALNAQRTYRIRGRLP